MGEKHPFCRSLSPTLHSSSPTQLLSIPSLCRAEQILAEFQLQEEET